MSAITQKRIEVELTLKPDPLVDIREDENWIHVGAVSLSKKYPRFSVGFSHPVVDETHFERQRFEVGEQRGWAIVLYSGGRPSDYFAGWVREGEEAKAAAWVERLNAEIQEHLARAQQIGDGHRAEVLTFHQGDESWGIETLRLSRAGELEYERRRAGKVLQTVHGNVESNHVTTLLATLAHTSFPTPPAQDFFPPGASVCTLITEPPFRRMDIEIRSGLGMKGYGEVIGALSVLCTALRDSNKVELARWNFGGEP